MSHLPHAIRRPEAWRATIALLFVLTLAVFFSPHTQAAAPAGAVIGNQATATYTDAGSVSRSATSNLVQTTVQQVKSFTLAAAGTKTGSPGQAVYFPHTITNTGNGTDTYTLNTPPALGGTAGAQLTGAAYYIDANGDGVPDNFTAITTSGAIASGGTFRFVVGGTVPAGATNGQSSTVTASVTDTGTPTTVTNVDTVNVANSVINVTKSMSSTSGASPSGAITVTLSYTNSGTAAATDVLLTDVLPNGMLYVAGSGRWSVSGSGVTLTDGTPVAETGSATGIEYTAPATSINGTITAKVLSVAAGVSGNVTFQVTVDTGISPTNGAIVGSGTCTGPTPPLTSGCPQVTTNKATYQTATQASTDTNAVTYTVLQTAGVVANGANNSYTDGVPAAIASAAPGTTITFTDYIWNRGNATDSFDITLTNTFPPGSIITLFKHDGATTLIDTNGNGTPDTGNIPGIGQTCAAPNVTSTTPTANTCGYPVVVKVTLPATYTAGSFTATLLATSKFNTGVSDSVVNTLTAMATNSVDVTNDVPVATAVVGDGLGAGTATVIRTNSVTPASGATTTSVFALYVNNTSGIADSYNLSVTSAIPAGWSVAFKANGSGTCTTLGAALTSTGTIAAAGNRLICAEVTIPSATSGNAPVGNNDFTFKATSTLDPTNVSDTIVDRVAILPLRSLTLTPNNTQQTYPGGTVTYSHTLQNLGNVTETVSFSSCTNSRSAQGWTSTVVLDANGNNTLDATPPDTLVTCGTTTTSLAPGISQTVFVRAFAPASAVGSDPANVTTINVTSTTTTTPATTAPTASATDSTSVTDGLTLLKEQTTFSTTCTSPADGFATTAIAASTKTRPGECVGYRVTATNTTAANVTNVVVSDIIPTNTTRGPSTCGDPAAALANPAGAAMTVTAPAVGATGTLSTSSVATLAPLQRIVLTFCVKIDP